MGIQTRPLRDRDDALRLQDLVYTAYGLTYHRSFMYEPDELLELNRSGRLRSVLALDSDGGEVVAHMATIRPWFEAAPPDVARRPPTSVEVGLSIVHPAHRGRRLQSAIGLACLMEERAANPTLASMFAKCLTVHTASQSSARTMLGRAGALLLGSVPAWVVHDSGRRPAPLTTVLIHSPCVPAGRDLLTPTRWAPLVRDLLKDSMLNRRVIAVPHNGARLTGATRLTRTFEPARRRGVIQVWEAGEDLVETVLATVRWMVQGHMEHVTVLLPLDQPGVAALSPQLEEAGLFFGGFVPDLDGRDVLVLQWLEVDVLDVHGIELLGDEAATLRDAVYGEWRRARASVAPVRAPAEAG